MRIAGGIIAIFLALIILVQSLAAGIVDSANGSGSGGSVGFLVAIGFVVAGALLIGKVVKGAMWVWAATSAIAFIGAASTIFGDLWVWGPLALIYSAACYWSIRKAKPETQTPTPTPAS